MFPPLFEIVDLSGFHRVKTVIPATPANDEEDVLKADTRPSDDIDFSAYR